jgi:hypothetical protein
LILFSREDWGYEGCWVNWRVIGRDLSEREGWVDEEEDELE